jgi:two-component system cell cycle response regulator DivK
MFTVLIVEDNVANIKLAETTLSNAGFKVLVAMSTEQALPLLHANQPDVVLMDIRLPRMDGVTALQYVRTDPALRATKIVAVTAMANKGDRERLLAGGFDGYVSKPYRPSELVDAVRAVLERK